MAAWLLGPALAAPALILAWSRVQAGRQTLWQSKFKNPTGDVPGSLAWVAAVWQLSWAGSAWKRLRAAPSLWLLLGREEALDPWSLGQGELQKLKTQGAWQCCLEGSKVHWQVGQQRLHRGHL